MSVQTASDVTKTQQQTTRQLAEGEMILVGIVDDAAKSSITLRLDNGETITLLSEGVEVVGEGSLTIGDWVEVVYVDEKAIQIIKK
ncbi:hypothetical protein FACS189418_8080 [Clostridia bacterium]|nr:hypothetical protein FACS189418_8080 [Clostridia bacterium]